MVYYSLEELGIEYPGTADEDSRRRALAQFLDSDLGHYAVATALGVNPQGTSWTAMRERVSTEEWAYALRRCSLDALHPDTTYLDFNGSATSQGFDDPSSELLYRGILLTHDGRFILVDPEQLRLWSAHCGTDVMRLLAERG